ncbi:Alg9-like mannosyltransferase family-domain-containing protein [Cladochytrium replicatum]|nr:Alg9-like mannosyltransferase family-domain-containing protein [Cladochytrium replicatum]
MEILTANQSLAHTPAPGLRHRTRAQPVNNDLPTTDNEEITQSTVTHQSLSGKTSAFSNHLIFVQTFLLVFAFRLFNVLMIRTFWQPDEYWQSLEIRGFAHPSIFVACYRFLHFLGLDDTEWLILGPKILQAFFASLTDCYTFMVASRYFGVGPARWSLISSLLSWFNFFCGVRTFSNTLETMFTVIALYYWPLPESNPNNQISYRDFRCALVIAVVGCLMRPTNALIWVFNGVQLAIRSRHTPRILVQITIDVVLVTYVVLAISGSVVIDHLFYGEIVLVPYNFVMSNIFSNIAVFYGTHPWHWYISQGVPVVLFSYLPVIFWIAHLDFRSAGRLSHSSSNIQPPSTALQRRKYMYSLLAWIISIYSMLGHKEFRFIYPIVPIGCILVGCALNKIAVAEKALRQINDAADPSTGDCQTLFRTVKRWFSPTRLKMVVFFLWITNTLAAYYLGMVHQRGVLDAEFYRYPHATNDHPGTAMDGILFLMPCHSTPYYSHIHRNIPMRFLSCEPPLGVDDRSKYLDESDIFYNDPISFIQTYFDGASLRTMNERRSSDSEPLLTVPGQTYSIRRCRWPSHVVLFDALLPRVEDLRLFRTSTNDQPGSFVYTECARFFNSHFHDDSRRMGDVIIFCKNVNALG